MDYKDLKNILLFKRIVEWKGDYIRLDNGVEIYIRETEYDCCAKATGEFEDVVLDAVITNVGDIVYDPWDDGYTYGCKAMVTILHNQNIICKAMANADAGNGGYYYSVASFCVRVPNTRPGHYDVCTFVSSEEGRK